MIEKFSSHRSEGHCWLSGDEPMHSRDSRIFGSVRPAPRSLYSELQSYLTGTTIVGHWSSSSDCLAPAVRRRYVYQVDL